VTPWPRTFGKSIQHSATWYDTNRELEHVQDASLLRSISKKDVVAVVDKATKR
jgi:hypothetical protein